MEFLALSMNLRLNKVFLLILVLQHVLNKNQPDATLAPLGNFCYEQKSKWLLEQSEQDLKYPIASLIFIL